MTESLTWHQAQYICAMYESTLVSVRSTEEVDFLQQLISSYGHENVWLGGRSVEDQFLWPDSSWFDESQDGSDTCLTLNAYLGLRQFPCDFDGFPTICVKGCSDSQARVCPHGWTEFQGRCYHYVAERRSWHEADTNCNIFDASLVSVHSPQEYAFLYQLSGKRRGGAWLAGFNLEDQWLWLDGSWFNEGGFAHVSPVSTFSCLLIYNADGWSNCNCDEFLPSVCVKDKK
ncbi:C-type mannose receptor 2-like [Thalassophryne amazonica]|uniref:C-type mannose receptor 2-like n=1 Tax=Thalassophryne amazonica TaxID=390379 RepID=UPI001471E07E|nr:C-type mannose receptor 2-like [Thalassophryne amazonica]